MVLVKPVPFGTQKGILNQVRQRYCFQTSLNDSEPLGFEPLAEHVTRGVPSKQKIHGQGEDCAVTFIITHTISM